MNLKVRNIDFKYTQEGQIESVLLRFDWFNQEEGTNLNGSVKATMEEYLKNSSDINALGEIVKTKVKVMANAL